MGYRDDRDAAFERAEALAEEVSRSHAAISERDRQIQLLHAELAAAKTRPPTPVELEDREEARRQGRRHVLRIVTLLWGCVTLVISGLVTIGLGIYVMGHWGSSTGLVRMARYSESPELVELARTFDGVFLMSHCALAVAMVILSIGMIGRTRWSAWGGAGWSAVAILLSLATGVAGHLFVGGAAWPSAIFMAMPPIVFGVYSVMRVRYELQ